LLARDRGQSSSRVVSSVILSKEKKPSQSSNPNFKVKAREAMKVELRVASPVVGEMVVY